MTPSSATANGQSGGRRRVGRIAERPRCRSVSSSTRRPAASVADSSRAAAASGVTASNAASASSASIAISTRFKPPSRVRGDRDGEHAGDGQAGHHQPEAVGQTGGERVAPGQR